MFFSGTHNYEKGLRIYYLVCTFHFNMLRFFFLPIMMSTVISLQIPFRYSEKSCWRNCFQMSIHRNWVSYIINELYFTDFTKVIRDYIRIELLYNWLFIIDVILLIFCIVYFENVFVYIIYPSSIRFYFLYYSYNIHDND